MRMNEYYHKDEDEDEEHDEDHDEDEEEEEEDYFADVMLVVVVVMILRMVLLMAVNKRWFILAYPLECRNEDEDLCPSFSSTLKTQPFPASSK